MRLGFGGAAAFAFALAVGATPAARAQHVVTEAEAGKLTLEALTAPPPPPRPIWHAYYRPAMSMRTVRVHGRYERVARVRTVRAVHEAAWHPAVHRARHRR